MNSVLRAAVPPSHRVFPSSAEDLAFALLKSELVAFLLVDSGHIVAASPALREMLGGSTHYRQIDGRSLQAVVADVDAPGVAEFCSATLNGTGRAEHRCHLMRADATPLPVL